MSHLIPEKRVNKNGHVVTKHVKAATTGSNISSLPAPAVSAPESAPLHKDRLKQREWLYDMYRKYPEPNLQAIVALSGPAYGNVAFQCSDVEAYDVLRASHGTNAILLLSIGIRSKDSAIIYYKANDLHHLIEDNDEWVDQALARNIPAGSALDMAGSWGSQSYRTQPGFLDALEANSVRVLREINNYTLMPVPTLIMQGHINYEHVKAIGATRLAKAARKTSIINQLREIHSGVSRLDIEGLKRLVEKYEIEGYPTHSFTDPITMAGTYGADTILQLRNFKRAADFLGNFTRKENNAYNRADVITYQDELYYWANGRHHFTIEDIFLLVDSGVPAREVITRLRDGNTINQIVAMSQNVQSSISSGWL